MLLILSRLHHVFDLSYNAQIVKIRSFVHFYLRNSQCTYNYSHHYDSITVLLFLNGTIKKNFTYRTKIDALLSFVFLKSRTMFNILTQGLAWSKNVFWIRLGRTYHHFQFTHLALTNTPLLYFKFRGRNLF